MASKSTINVRILGDNKGLRDSLDDSDGRIGKWASGLAGLVAAGAAAAGVAVAAGLAKGLTDALDAQSNDALIVARLGVTPERAAELGDIAASAYRDAWGDSLEQTTDAVTGLESSFENLGADELEALTGRAIALGDAFAIDVGQGIQTAAELVESGLASSADEAFDLLARGLQEMPQAIRDELIAASNEYGDFFGDLGISGDVAFAKLTEFAEGGVYGIDKFGDALKELTIRGTDMSTASVDAYAAAGLSAEEMAARFLAGGDTARQAVEDTAAGLLAIEDPVERANAAIALFGTPLEDLSTSEIPGFLDGLTDLSDGLDGVDGAAQAMADNLGGTTSAKLETFKRQALGALADFAAEELLPRFEQVVDWFEVNWPTIRRYGEETFAALRSGWDNVGRPVFDGLVIAGTAVVGWFRENWPEIQATINTVVAWLRDEAWPVVQQILGFIRTEFDNVVGWVRENWPEIQETIAGVIEAIQIIIETAIAIISQAWETWGETLVGFVTRAWDRIKETIKAALDIVRGIINTVTSLIRGDWDGAWEGIKLILSGVWDSIKLIVDNALDVVKTALALAWDAVGDQVTEAWNGITGFFSDTWDGLTGIVSDGIDSIVGVVTDLPGDIASAASGAFDSVWNSFKAVMNRIVDGWNGLEFSLPSIDTKIPGVGRIGGFKIGTPDIPRFHQGGYVPGSRGQEVPAILEAGEFVVRRSIVDAGGAVDFGGSGGNVYQIHIDGAVNDESTLRVFERRLVEIEQRRAGAA